jgi:AraC family transcriptional regulator
MDKQQTPEYLRKEYVSRINRVIDYIDKNIEQDLCLDQLAGIANFSSYHFHRIFSSITGESLNKFIQRLRIEKAASALLVYPEKTITEIAYGCGFNSSASFARSFKDFYNMSASEWRRVKNEKSRNCKTESKNCKNESKIGKDMNDSSMYIDKNNKNTWRKNMFTKDELKIEVKELQDMPVAYVRHIGPYKGDEKLFERLIGKLCTWAGPRDLLNFPETKMMAIYHDSPEITDENKLRISICITVPENTKVDGDIGKMIIKGGKYAIASFELRSDQFEDAWQAVYGIWLPESGCQPENGPTFELYQNDPKEHPEGKHLVDICIPVKPI